MAGNPRQGDESLTCLARCRVEVTQLDRSHDLRSAETRLPASAGRETVSRQPFVNVWQFAQSSFLSVTCLSWTNVKVPVLALWQDAQSGLPLRVESGA